jgi:uncharacterized delta-60 repeat protein
LEDRHLLSATSSIDLPSVLSSLPAAFSQPLVPISGIPETITVPPAVGPDQVVVVEPNGKVVVVHGDGLTTTMNAYNADGTPDMDFGSGGQVTDVFGTSRNSVAAMGLQSDGKIVVVGWVLDQNLKSSFAIVRYNSDGSLDTSFGNRGTVVTSVDQGDDLPTSVAIQSDGKIVIGGAAGESLPWNWNPNDPGFHPDFLTAPRSSPVLLRYNPDGSLDSSFNGTGIDEFTYDGYPSLGYASPYLPSPLPLNDGDSITQVQVQADGKIIVAAGPDISRINADGSLDTTFGQDGVVTVPLPLILGAIDDLLIQPDGKFLIATTSYAAANEFAIYISRYNADGSLDMAFNHGLPVSTPETPDGWGDLTDLAVGSDGKIVATATVNYLGVQSYGVVARYNPDGSLDTSFGGTGQVVEHSYGWNVAVIQSDGKVVAVGGGVLQDDGVQATSDFHVKRFNADGTEDVDFNSNVMTPVNPPGPAPAPPALAPPKAASPTTTVLQNTPMPLAPPSTSSGAAESVAAKSVTSFVDSVPSIQVFSVDQAISQLTSATADSQMIGSLAVARSAPNPAPPRITTMTTASPVAATITLIAPDDAVEVALANDGDVEDKNVDDPLFG